MRLATFSLVYNFSLHSFIDFSVFPFSLHRNIVLLTVWKGFQMELCIMLHLSDHVLTELFFLSVVLNLGPISSQLSIDSR